MSGAEACLHSTERRLHCQTSIRRVFEKNKSTPVYIAATLCQCRALLRERTQERAIRHSPRWKLYDSSTCPHCHLRCGAAMHPAAMVVVNRERHQWWLPPASECPLAAAAASFCFFWICTALSTMRFFCTPQHKARAAQGAMVPDNSKANVALLTASMQQREIKRTYQLIPRNAFQVI